MNWIERFRRRQAYRGVPRHPDLENHKVTDTWPVGVPRTREVRRRMAGLRKAGR